MSDEHVNLNQGTGQAVSVRLISYDRHFIVLTLSCLALAVSIVAVIFCSAVEGLEQKRLYFTMRCEQFAEDAQFKGKPISVELLKRYCGDDK